MMAFGEKAIFIWNYWVMHNGDVNAIAADLVQAGFEAAYVHTTDGIYEARTQGKANCTAELVAALKTAGLTVYGWGAPYGQSPLLEAQIAASQTRRYGLAGYIFDAEGTWDAKSNAVANTAKLLAEYKRLCPDTPTCWCWWAFFKNSKGVMIHPEAILAEAMQHCDAGMPMAYWNSPTDNGAAFASGYLERSYTQWKPYLNGKAFVPAGRAFYGSGLPGIPTPAAIAAFEAKARSLGAVGVTWWDLQHAVKLPDVWQALTQTPQFNHIPDDDGKDEPMDYTKNAVGLYTKTAGWTNKDFDFIVGYSGGDWSARGKDLVLEPNPNLAGIELQARKEGNGKTFLALWDFDVDYYRRQQYNANEQAWPDETLDYPYKALVAALQNRDIDGLIIRVMNRENLDGGDEGMNYVAFAARKFVERVNKWLYQNKGLNKYVFVLTSDTFLRVEDKQEFFYSWLKDWYIGIEQEAVRPLASGAWPQATDKIKAIPPSKGWKLWYHHNAPALDMMIWNGTEEDMRTFLGAVTPPLPPPADNQDIVKLYEMLKAQAEQVAGLTAQVDELNAWRNWRK
jgi:hypothetical protein